tara:strand:+ start:635 stop:955 length:321 start_codon:yes stop_codon:yes gene_type:complete
MIRKEEIHSQILYKDSDVFAIYDINPRAPIHILVIPLKHVVFSNLKEKILLDILGKLSLSARKIAEKFDIKSEGYRLVINQGNNAGQTVEHLHMHLIGGKKLAPEG